MVSRARSPRRQASAPRYQRIAERLIAEIRRGRYHVGSVLPTEHELCERFRASRYTVRAAMRELTEKGLVSRRPRAGSIVTATEQPAVFTQTVASVAEMLNYPDETFREVRDTGMVAANRELASLLQCAVGTQWFRISALRRVPRLDVPLAWTDIYILPIYADVVKRNDHGRTPVFMQLEAQYGVQVERARLDVFAATVPTKLARALNVEASSGALTIVRRYYTSSGENFENTVSIHPGNRYTYSIELHRALRAVR